MKKLFTLLGALLVLGSGTASAWTVYFTNPSGWGDPHCYVWNEGNNNVWSGPSMEKIGNIYRYKADLSFTPNNIIFSNNGSDSERKEFNSGVADNNVYDTSNSLGNINSFKKYTIYFDDTSTSWKSNVKVYTFVNNAPAYIPWPGGTYTSVSGNIYTFEIYLPSNSNEPTIIFSNNGNNQGENCKLENGQTYTKDGIKDAKPNYTSWWVGVGGSFNNNNYTTYQAQPNAEGVAEINNVPVGTGNFQIKVWNGSNDTYYSNRSNSVALDQWVTLIDPQSTSSPIADEKKAADSKYNFKFDCTNNQVYITWVSGGQTEVAIPEEMYIVGDFNNANANSWDDTSKGIKMTRVSGTNKWTAHVYMRKNVYQNNNNNTGYTNYFKFRSGAGNLYGTVGTADETVKKGEAFTARYDSNEHSFIADDGSYDVTFELDNYGDATVTLTQHLPEQLYIYGHINDEYWTEKNYEELKQSETEPGVYVIERVLITGTWSPYDTSLGDGRGEYASTDDENYIAFFETNNRKDNDTPEFKYGSTEPSNLKVYQPTSGKADDNGQDTRVYPTYTEKQEGLMGIGQGNFHNYMVGDGWYKITVNLNEMWVKFERKEVQSTEYQWFVGDKALKTDEPELIEDESFDIDIANGEFARRIQVGVDNNTEHRVARQVEFTVWKKIATSSDATNNQRPSYSVKRRADQPDGYVPAEEGENKDYSALGGSDYSSNHVIQFNAEGDYLIEATLSDGAQKIAGYFERPKDTTLAVTVSDTTGVADIAADSDNGEAVYYNLQGVKVANPDRGIFVKVQNGKAAKVIL